MADATVEGMTLGDLVDELGKLEQDTPVTLGQLVIVMRALNQQSDVLKLQSRAIDMLGRKSVDVDARLKKLEESRIVRVG